MYHQWGREFPVPDSFKQFVTQCPWAVESGFYYTHTKRYLHCFPRENIHLVVFEDIRDAPETVLADLFDFLDVDVEFLPSNLHERVNERKAPRSILLRDFIGNARDYLNTHPRLSNLKRLLAFIGAEAVTNWAYRINLATASFPPMDSDTRAHLVGIYADEVRELSDLLDRDLSHWNE
jgi:hypothetical protein